jgi:peptidyl-prolyl cis-trans isomerase D
MLRFMRKHASRWVLGGLLAIIIITFVFGFGFSRGGSGDKSAAVVGDYKISPAEYWDAYKKAESYYRMIYKEGLTDRMRNELKETVIKQLVDRYALLAKAEEMGLTVTDREIQDNLDSVDYFKTNGKFDEKKYEEFLRRNNLNPQQFEKEQWQSLLLNKLVSIIQDNGARIDDKAAYESYVREKGRVRLSLAVFDPKDYTAKVTVDDKDLEAVYEREKAMYRTENRWRLKYLTIDAKSGVRDDQA